jgi:hypothetical protein
VHRPSSGQLLVADQDLLHDQVEQAVIAVAPCRIEAFGRLQRLGGYALLNPTEVPGRVVKPVRMVNAQTGEFTLGNQVEHQTVRRLEGLGILHA